MSETPQHIPSSIVASKRLPKRIPLGIENFISKNKWVFAKTMAEIPHYYIVRDNLSEDDKKLFDEFDVFINKNGYTREFYSKQYTYFDVGKFKYWVIENILNRAEIENQSD